MPSSNLPDPDKILLDTHVWLWCMLGISKGISPGLKTLIDRLKPQRAVCISSISIWEIGLLSAKNKISFEGGVKNWIFRSLNQPGFTLVDVTAKAALESTLLPNNFHGDPADRILTATALEIGAKLVTHDKELLSQGKNNDLPIICL